MALNFEGKYKLQSSENWPELLKAAGVGLVQRNMMAALSPPVEITESGDSYVIRAVTPVKTYELKFNLGVEFDDKNLSGTACKSIVTRDGNVLKHVQTSSDAVLTTLREITEDGKLIVTVTAGDVTCKRIYQKESK